MTARNMSPWSTRIATMLSTITLAFIAGDVVGDTPRNREYSISADPETVVLRIEPEGGLMSFRRQYLLFGDGKLTENTMAPNARDVIQTTETQLSFPDIERLFTSLLAGGAMEYEWTRYSEEVRSFHVDDMPGLFAKIKLDSYVTPNGEKHGPVSKIVRIPFAWELAKRHPEIGEIQLLVEAYETLGDWAKHEDKRYE